MEILNSLISSIKEDHAIHQIITGVHWTAVVSKYCGLSSTFQDPPPHRPIDGVGNLAQRTALELAEFAKSDIQLEASIGMAALNSLIEVNEKQCIELNAFDELAEQGKEKKIAIVGHFASKRKAGDKALNSFAPHNPCRKYLKALYHQ